MRIRRLAQHFVVAVMCGGLSAAVLSGDTGGLKARARAQRSIRSAGLRAGEWHVGDHHADHHEFLVHAAAVGSWSPASGTAAPDAPVAVLAVRIQIGRLTAARFVAARRFDAPIARSTAPAQGRAPPSSLPS